VNHPRHPREIETRLTPEMLAETPERATVEALRAVLDVTLLALIAANPEMLDDGWSAMPERAQIPCLRVAHRILGHGHALRRELVRYAHLLDRQRERTADLPNDDLPF
jgi:hypothetical protein